MKRLLILGAGTGGTALANRMRNCLRRDAWKITVVDPDEMHLYQPGLLFLPFGAHEEAGMLRPRRDTFARGVEWIRTAALRVDASAHQVTLVDDTVVPYDLLVIASGCRVRPDLTPGLTNDSWRNDVFDFYTLGGAQGLRHALASFTGGRLVLNVVEMPIKCPVAPLEFLFLADAWLTERGLRSRTELVFATPLDAAFTRPMAAKKLGYLLAEKNIKVETEFACSEVDREKRIVRSYDEREVPYDLLVSIPTHSGAELVERSGIGNELAFVPTDPRTLAARGLADVFVIGDATDVPASKAGSVAHFQSEVLADNLLRVIAGKPLEPTFDGHSNCFVETGHGKAMLIDFNYDVEPLPGTYPLATIGPFRLLEESRMNHWGKRAFKWIYWNGLLPARPIPVPAQMSMKGKIAAPPAASP